MSLKVKNNKEKYEYCQEKINVIVNKLYAEEITKISNINHARTELEQRAEENGVINNPTIQKTLSALDQVWTEYKKISCGYFGEKKALESLRVISSPVTVLNNIELSQDDIKTEIDALVISKSGIIIVEVKNSKYNAVIDEKGIYRTKNNKEKSSFLAKNIVQNMKNKEYVVWKTIDDKFPGLVSRDLIAGIVMFVNDDRRITCKYNDIIALNRNEALKYIENHISKELFSIEEIEKIKDTITQSKTESEYEIEIDFDAVINLVEKSISIIKEAYTPEDLNDNLNGEWSSFIMGSLTTIGAIVLYKLLKKAYS